jgi:hypothetical protein
MNFKNAFIFLLTTLIASAPAVAEQYAVKRYVLPSYGEIEFTIPADWKDDIRRPPNKLPPTIRFTTPNEQHMSMLITLLWPDRPDMKMPGADWMKSRLEEAKKGIQSQAVEDELVTHSFTGGSGNGFYFKATDRSPEKNDFKYMTHGMLRIGEVLASFTILNNEGHHAQAEEGLAVLQRAVHHQAYKK